MVIQPPHLDIPNRIETERLVLRCYQPGDGRWYYEMSLRNRSHLLRYESGNYAMSIHSKDEAENLVRHLAAQWARREAFFLGGFEKETGEFAVQIYIGPVDWDLPQFQLGYFVDVAHEGKGYVTEAAQASIRFIFDKLKAHRISLECDETNTRSYRVAERCGMVREGHIRQNRRNPDGSLSGTLYYGLLRGEYQP